jgi:cyclopropane-fatty-acyl-phospholipid synthase
MQATKTSAPERVRGARLSSRVEKWLLARVFRLMGPLPIRLIVGNGTGFTMPGVVPRFTVWARDLRTVAEVLMDPEMAFGDAWSEGRIEVIGDLTAFLDIVYAAMAQMKVGPGPYLRLVSQWSNARQTNTLEGSRTNIQAHYDLGNDFYRLWLGSELIYTCAYFPSPAATLEGAQIAKMDHICRKLRLQPGETVTEAGCGWGALALHMARCYGVRVKAFNISKEQIRHARQRARDEDLDNRVEFIEDDYRNASGNCDAFVSVGMLEHVGRENYDRLGDVVHRAIGDTGRGLLHFIGRSEQMQFSRWIRKRIFPGAYAPSLCEVLRMLEPYGYLVQDVENLRAHYAKTLELWLDRFSKANGQVVAMYGTAFERAWRLYLAGSIAGFRSGNLQLFQVLFSGAKFGPVAWTREDLYTPQRNRTG